MQKQMKVMLFAGLLLVLATTPYLKQPGMFGVVF